MPLYWPILQEHSRKTVDLNALILVEILVEGVEGANLTSPLPRLCMHEQHP